MAKRIKKCLCLAIALAMLLTAVPLTLTAGADPFDESLCNYDTSDGKIAIYCYVAGASSVSFPTWTSSGGQDDIIWHEGFSGTWSKNGHSYNWAVVIYVSDHNYESGEYVTHIYVNGKIYTAMSYTINCVPTVHRVTAVQNGTSGYNVYTYVTSNGVYDIARVQFPTWTLNNGQDDLTSDWSTNAGCTGTAGSWTVDGQYYNYSYYVPFSSHNSELGTYSTHVYAYNTIGAYSNGGVDFTPNMNCPTVTDIAFEQNGTDGYYAYASVSENGGYAIDRVQFPTWTTNNSQDDLAASWSTNASVTGTAGSWTVDGKTYNYRAYIPVSSHNNEYGQYCTDVYVYNKGGLSGSRCGYAFNFSFGLTVDAGDGTYSGNTALTGNYESTVDIGTPTAPEGKHFTGWTLSGAGSFAGSTYTYGAGDGTLTANYSEHDYTTYVSEQTKADCTTNQFCVYKCYCGATAVKEIEGTQLNHSYTGEYIDNGDFTHSRKCVNGCDLYGDKQTHSYTEFVGTASKATCTENRFDTYKCVCGATIEIEIIGTRTGHSFDKANGVKTAGDGKHYFKCADCDAYGVDTVANATEDCTGGTATCTGKAVCDVCREEYGNINANNHDFTKQDQSQLATKATCTDKATYYYTCSRCDAKGTETYEYGDVDTSNHDFTAEVATAEHLKAEADCSNAAVYYKSCTRCGKNGTETFSSGDALGHNFNGTAKNAGEGKHYFKCERCDAYGVGTEINANENCTGGTANCTDKAICEICATDYGETDSNNHDFTKQDQSQKATDANCTEKATYYYTCSRCDAKGTETYEYGDVDENNHDFTAEVATAEHLKAEADCTNAAVYYKSCSRCGKNGTETFSNGDALGHNFNGTAKNAGEGKHNFKCERCDAYGVGTEINANENCTGGTANCTDKAICEICATAYGETDSNNHDFTKQDQSQKATDATCTEKATYYYTCSRCDAKGTETYEYGDVDASNHDFTAEVATAEHLKAEADCTNAAVYYKSCSRCGKNGTETFSNGDALGHYFNGTAKNAGEGKHNFKCERCDAYGVGTEINATENCTGGTANCTDKAICEICATAYGETDSNNHDFTKQDQSQKATDATCTEKATYYYTCSRCDAKGTETYEYGDVDASNHDFTAEVATAEHLKAEADCTNPAVYYKSCTRCGKNGTEVFTSGDALGHNFNGTVKNTGEGKHNFKCERCDAYGVGTEINATANCTGGTANCKDKAICEICATAYGELNAENHKSPENRDATPATCTEKGLSAGIYCTACDKWVTEQTETEALGHKWVGGEWSFSEDGKTATITFTCENDNAHKQVVNATVTSAVYENAKCTEKGTTRYTATVEFEGRTYTETKDVADIDELGHDYIEHEAVAPTCAKAGNKAYVTCSRCDYTTFEELATTDHNPGTPVNENRVYGNGSSGSYDTVTYCTFCGKELSRTTEVVDYDCPACRMEEIAEQLGADTAAGKLISFMHTVLHTFFCLFDSVIKK